MADVNNKKKILILDDDKFLLNMYSMKFQAAGAEVDTAETGAELLTKLKGGTAPDALILDVIVPGISGLEVLEQIRKEKLASASKVILLTNESDPAEIEKAKTLAIDGYIVKAMATPSEVVEQVMKIMA